MFVYILISVFILNFQVESATICEITVCECENINNSIIAKCWLDQDAFKSNLSLTNTTISLDLSGNNLTSIVTANIFKSDELEELFLNDNDIKDINPNSLQLPQLKTLDLSNNLLEKLNPDIFKGMTKLENLYLANNKFTITSVLNFSCLINLQKINIDNNFLGPDIILRPLFNASGYGLPTTIKSLSISGINLTDLPENYFDFVKKSLKELTVSNNSLTKLFKLPFSIEYLDVSSNPIKNLNLSDFSDHNPLTNLRVLKLNNLEIVMVQRNIFSTLKLTELELSNNRYLKEFSNLTFGGKILKDSNNFSLKNLSLCGSNLSTIDKGLSVLFERVERLNLQNNPWVCDCNLAWVRELPIAANLTEDLRCAYPRHLHNLKIFDLEPTDFKCPKYHSGWISSEAGITIGAVLYSMLVVVSLLWIYKFVHKPAHRQGYSQLH